MGTTLLVLFLAMPCCHASAFTGPCPPSKALTVTFYNQCDRELYILADAKTTIDSYKDDMQQMSGGAGSHYKIVAAGGSISFQSIGDFLTKRKDMGQTFWAATGCDQRTGQCDWNADRKQGAVIEWNMFEGILYYDISAVEAMDEFVYSMKSNCADQPSTCVFDMDACPRAAPNARVTTSQGGVTYCNAPKTVCFLNDLNGVEADTCTDNSRAMCTVWGDNGTTGKKVYYQEYAQTHECGCIGCDRDKNNGKGPASDSNRCKIANWERGAGGGPGGGPFYACEPQAIQETPFYREMRKHCDWGYAYPYDDARGGWTCGGPNSPAHVRLDVNISRPRPPPEPEPEPEPTQVFYRCSDASGKCEADFDGHFKTNATCSAVCHMQPPSTPIQYSCDKTTGACINDTRHGMFDSIAFCNEQCRVPPEPEPEPEPSQNPNGPSSLFPDGNLSQLELWGIIGMLGLLMCCFCCCIWHATSPASSSNESLRRLLLDSDLTDSMAGRLFVAMSRNNRPLRGGNEARSRRPTSFAKRLSRGLFGSSVERSSVRGGAELMHGQQLQYRDVAPVYCEGQVCQVYPRHKFVVITCSSRAAAVEA